MSSHEDYIVEHILPRDGDIFVDVGAAFGFYTILGSKRVGLRGKVVAIESQPNNFEMLTHNIKLNKLTNVIPLNYAVYSKETKLKLYSNYSVMPQRTEEKNKEKFVEVNADTLDNLLQQNGISEINWIKIDVEGAELEVLKELTMCYLKVKSLHFL
jgi:FkbM family methyltransferase